MCVGASTKVIWLLQAWAPQRQQPASRLRIYVYDLPFTLVQMHVRLPPSCDSDLHKALLVYPAALRSFCLLMLHAICSTTCESVQDVADVRFKNFLHIESVRGAQAARHLHDIGIYLAYLAFHRTLLADVGGVRTENPYEANLFLIPAQTCATHSFLNTHLRSMAPALKHQFKASLCCVPVQTHGCCLCSMTVWGCDISHTLYTLHTLMHTVFLHRAGLGCTSGWQCDGCCLTRIRICRMSTHSGASAHLEHDQALLIWND